MHNADLPKHRYVWVRNDMLYREPEPGLTPAVWFGISSTPGRAFGCHVLLESGATVIDLPLNALYWTAEPEVEYQLDISDAVDWDSFGWAVEVYEPEYLSGLTVDVLPEGGTGLSVGEAWFAIDWTDNGWSDYPEQHKWLWVVADDSGRLIARPQNRLLFYESSFTNESGVGQGGIRRQTEVWKAEQ